MRLKFKKETTKKVYLKFTNEKIGRKNIKKWPKISKEKNWHKKRKKVA